MDAEQIYVAKSQHALVVAMVTANTAALPGYITKTRLRYSSDRQQD